jgi:hypothetical protein
MQIQVIITMTGAKPDHGEWAYLVALSGELIWRAYLASLSGRLIWPARRLRCWKSFITRQCRSRSGEPVSHTLFYLPMMRMNSMSQPLMILGAPRSGTTFLCQTLNQHPEITLTNESRVFMQLKHMIEAQTARTDLLGEEFQAPYLEFIRATAGGWIERFYREGLNIETKIWGDKHPPYADPTALSGRRGALPNLPESGSCLRLIREVLPHAKFIHIHRHPALVARSLVRKGWIGTMQAGHEVWRQYVSEITGFFDELPHDRQLTIGHAELLIQPDQSARDVARFLDLADAAPIYQFLCRQRSTPTPFSEPISDLSESYLTRVRAGVDDHALGAAAAWAERFGYAEAVQRVA